MQMENKRSNVIYKCSQYQSSTTQQLIPKFQSGPFTSHCKLKGIYVSAFEAHETNHHERITLGAQKRRP
jgi:hypothetical protein